MNIESIDASCPMCDSPEYITLGYLGATPYCRCRDCGFDYTININLETE